MILGLLIFVLAILSSLIWLSAGGIDYIKESEPESKDEDILDLDFDENDKNNIT